MEDSARRLFPIFSFSRAGYLPFHIARCYFLLWRACQRTEIKKLLDKSRQIFLLSISAVVTCHELFDLLVDGWTVNSFTEIQNVMTGFLIFCLFVCHNILYQKFTVRSSA